MKQTLILSILSFILFPGIIIAQVFAHPESIVYDSGSKTYFISNNKNGSIVKIDDKGIESLFVSGYVSFLGISVFKETIYVAENRKDINDRILAFDKKNGKIQCSLEIPDSKQLNDVLILPNGALYVSDRVGNKIYQCDTNLNHWAIVDSGIQTPNGLWYDQQTKSIFICNTIDSSSVYIYSPDSGQLREWKRTTLPHLDGICTDNSGNVYVSSWSADWTKSQLIKLSKKSLDVLLENDQGMADIAFNALLNQIDIACFLGDSVIHYSLKRK